MASVFVVVVDDVVVLVVVFFRSRKKGQTSMLCDCHNQFSNPRVDCHLKPASARCSLPLIAYCCVLFYFFFCF